MTMINIDELSKRPSHADRRILKSKAITGLVVLLSAITTIPLAAILIELIIKGAPQINWSFFTEVVPSSIEAMIANESGNPIPGGVANGIIGTLIMVAIAAVISIPIGLLCGIYLSEHREQRFSGLVRDLVDILQGVPSIVCGVVVYMWVVQAMHGYSALAGGIALAIMMIPMITRSTEEALLMIPQTLKEAGLAMGSSYTSVMLRVILPSAFGGIFTGILLAISRVMGETAPLMVTVLGANFVHLDLTKPMSALSLLIWEFYNDPNLAALIWSTSLMLLLIILALNLVAKAIAAKWRIQ